MKSKELTFTIFNIACKKFIELHQILKESKLEKKIEDYAISFVANNGKQKIQIEIVENE